MSNNNAPPNNRQRDGLLDFLIGKIEGMEISIGNRLIAKFLKWDFEELNNEIVWVPNLYPMYHKDDERQTGATTEKISRLEFHERFDWLMPVIEIIAKIKFTDDPDGDGAYPRTFGMINSRTGNFMFRFNRYGVFGGKTLIEAAWLSVVDFIEFNDKTTTK